MHGCERSDMWVSVQRNASDQCGCPWSDVYRRTRVEGGGGKYRDSSGPWTSVRYSTCPRVTSQ